MMSADEPLRAPIAESRCWDYLRTLRARLFADDSDQGKSFDLGILLRILRALGVSPGAFFAGIFGRLNPIAQLRRETCRLGEPPETIAKVRGFLLETGWELLPELPEELRKREVP